MTNTVETPAPPMQYRLLIFVGVVLGANLQVLDTTMATVALPHIQGALSATQDEIAWVLASYLIAVAIFMPLVGTLSERIGRRRLFLGTIVGFCIASMFTGAADSLFEIVVYRFLQGVFASPLVPISQSFVFDTFPPEKRGKAMGWWVLGLMFGALLGPALGGYLTEFHSWRWAFYINVPLGIVSFAIIYIFGPTRRLPRGTQPFGMAGFLILSVGLVSLQIVFSRGERMDWFSSPQIVSAALLAAASLYVYTVHTAYSSRPFIPRAVFADRNFCIGLMLAFMNGIHWLAFLALISPYLQTLAGYPVLLAGLVLVPQALGKRPGSLHRGAVAEPLPSRATDDSRHHCPRLGELADVAVYPGLRSHDVLRHRLRPRARHRILFRPADRDHVLNLAATIHGRGYRSLYVGAHFRQQRRGLSYRRIRGARDPGQPRCAWRICVAVQ